MKNYTSLLCIAFVFSILVSSCGMGRHMPSHGAVTPASKRSFKESQHGLSDNYGGRNMKRPNHFKQKHF